MEPKERLIVALDFESVVAAGLARQAIKRLRLRRQQLRQGCRKVKPRSQLVEADRPE